MKKVLTFISATWLITLGVTSCSSSDINPEEYTYSILTGEYGIGSPYKLYVTENGETIENYGYVRFEAKPELKEADFRFVDVITGQSRMEFKNVPLTPTEEGYYFLITSDRTVISGYINFGAMSITIELSER